MRDQVTIDMRDVWSRLEAVPDKSCYRRGRTLTNEEEWAVWLMYPRKRQKILARELGMGGDKLREFYEALKATNGPKGKRPEWMK